VDNPQESTTAPAPLSRWRRLHRLLGPLLALLLAPLALTGILLNHPGLAGRFSLPLEWLPDDYGYHDWNRGTLSEATWSAESQRWLLAGKEGIWSFAPGGVAQPVGIGFPRGAWDRMSESVGLFGAAGEEGAPSGAGLLLAGTRDGLWGCGVTRASSAGVTVARNTAAEDSCRWKKFPETSGERIRSVVGLSAYSRAAGGIPETQLEGGAPIIVMGHHRAWILDRDTLSPASPARQTLLPLHATLEGELPRTALFRWVFDLHSGTLFGLPGRLAMDAAALGLLLFAGTGLYQLLFRKRLRQGQGAMRPRMGRLFAGSHKNHRRVGRWVFALLLISGLTGMVMRPPGLVLIGFFDLPWATPTWGGSEFRLPFKPERAAWDAQRQGLWVAAEEGLFFGQPATTRPATGAKAATSAGANTNAQRAMVSSTDWTFRAVPLGVPIHGMGCTALGVQGDGSLLIGSFSGLFAWHPESGAVRAYIGDARGGGRPAETMVMGAGLRAGEPVFVAGYAEGIVPGSREIIAPPPELARQSQMSLWHAAFEVHNWRILQPWIGNFYMLLVGFCGAALTALAWSGWRLERTTFRRKAPRG